MAELILHSSFCILHLEPLMPASITMPQLSDTMSEGTLIKWYKKVGDAVKGGEEIADIEIGYRSALACHLGNIAYRTGRTVNLDPATHQVSGDKEQQALWRRQYHKGWEPKV